MNGGKSLVTLARTPASSTCQRARLRFGMHRPDDEGGHDATSASSIHVDGARLGSRSSEADHAARDGLEPVAAQPIEARLHGEVADDALHAADAEAGGFDLADQLVAVVERVEDRIAVESLALPMRQAHGAILRVDDQRAGRRQRAADLGVQPAADVGREAADEADRQRQVDAAVGDRQRERVAAHDQPVAAAVAQAIARHGQHLGAAVDGDAAAAQVELGGQARRTRARPRARAAAGARRGRG